MVVILHETDAVPLRLFDSGRLSCKKDIIFVLGAVRDMTAWELQLVEEATAYFRTTV